MDSHGADKQAFQQYHVSGAANQDDFSFSMTQPSQQFNVHDFPQSGASGPSMYNGNFSHDHLAGPGNNPHAAGQLSKRVRSNSDEESQARLPQILGLLSRASTDDLHKILLFLKGDSTALSSDPWMDHASRPSLSQPNGRNVASGAQQFHASTEAISQSAFAPANNVDQYQQQWMQPVHDSSHDPNAGTFMSDYSGFPLNYPTPSRVSMPIQSTTYHTPPPPRSHVSQPPPLTDSAASTVAAFILRQKMIGNIQDLNRDSVQTMSSFSSMETDITPSTNRSSTTTLSSQTSQPPRKLPPQKTMSSSTSSKKTHRRIPSTGSSTVSSPAPRIPCTHPTCTTTFGRPSDRVRHLESIHNNNSGYTCLLHTCSQSCPDACKNEEHIKRPLRNARQDKMKEHLEKVHGWRLEKMSDVPTAFGKSAEWEREKRGWRCGLCGKELGSWWDVDGRREIEEHAESCTGELELEIQGALKRLSVEDPVGGLIGGLAKNGSGLRVNVDKDKALPRKPVVVDQELEDWVAGYMFDMERNSH
ncbi:hypothetical protein G7Y89_g7891 [Cudoniella acicularis]|uniref:C2H2-type domain-containing protein n=1 Tax=Cudoniella acicularis TaxID=354080 RepID=A0A8H4RJ75_9HELO|nr:hypothetical protein G7Y89_g7891 [Cudoniella acicularis]